MTIDVSFPQMVTERISWRIPRGSAGMVGWQLWSGTGQVIPKNQGAYLILDGDSGAWQLEGLHDSGDWQVVGYNTGAYPHTINLDFWVRPINTTAPQGDRTAAIAGLAMANLTPAYRD